MKKLFTLFLFTPFLLNAQVLRPDLNQLNFGITQVGAIDSLQLTLNNSSASSINVTNIKFYNIYNETPFSASENSFPIPANGSKTIWVYFEPVQNILHNTEMVVQHNATSGFEAIDLIGQGRFPIAYYNNTENLEEQALKNMLKTITGQGFSQQSYSGARDAMFMTIDNQRFNGQGANTNTLECVYTGTTITGYSSRSAAQNGNPQFNTEHTFPQGFFNSSLPERSDLHHLFPTTNNSNSQRSNSPFGIVTNGNASGGGSFYTNSLYEPRDFQKGRTARAMMYFVIRYQDYASHFSTQENILRGWHNQFPVDAIETKRNDDIFLVQNNRNPFVDYPQLEERITNFVTNSVAPQTFGLDILQTSVNFGAFLNQQADTFDYVMVNRGSRVINFSNFALSNGSILSFGGTSGTNQSLNPGEAIEISVIVQTSTTTQVNESLSFTTNIPGSLGSFTIPISGQSVITSIDKNILSDHLEVFPNPLQNQLYVRLEGNQMIDIRMLDALGKRIDLDFMLNQPNNKIINTSALTRGVYFLEISEGNSSIVKKLIK